MRVALLREVRASLLSFLLVVVRAQSGLIRLSDREFRYVSRRALLVAVLSTGSFFLLAIALSGDASAIAVILGSGWGTLCLVKVAVLLSVEKSRRDTRF